MKKHRFENKLFLKFFIPALFSSLGLAIGAIADSIYIGNTMNEKGLFILGATSPIYMIFTMFAVGIAIGGSIHFSGAMSTGNELTGRKVFSSVIIFNFLFIASLSVIGYFASEHLVVLLGCSRTSGVYTEMLNYVKLMFITSPVLFMQAPLQFFVHADNGPKCASAAMITGTLVDCVSGYCFIVIGGQGVNGSIWSTLLGAVSMELICIFHLISGKGVLKIKNMVLPEIKTAKNAFLTGFASATQYLYQFIIIFAFNRILIEIKGEFAVSVYDVVTNASTLCIAIIDAITMAMIPIITTFYGERNKGGVYKSLNISLTYAVVITALATVIMFFTAKAYCTFTGLSPEFAEFGVWAVRIVFASMIFACINSVLTAFFQNTDSEKLAYFITALRGLLILLPCGLLFSKLGFKSFWWCYIITEAIVFVIAVFIHLYLKNKGGYIDNKFKKSTVFSETFVGSCNKISETCERLQTFLEDNGASAKKAYFITLAVDETCRLIAENGNELMLQLTLVYENNKYTLHIRDNAGSFNPFDLDDSDESAMGLKIVKKQAEDFYYRRLVGFNTLTIVFGGE